MNGIKNLSAILLIAVITLSSITTSFADDSISSSENNAASEEGEQPIYEGEIGDSLRSATSP